VKFDFDIWPIVSTHGWKYRSRDPQIINLIQIHATRSGRKRTRLGRRWTMEDERKSTTNWFRSPNNRVPGAPHEAAMASVLIGNGTLTRVMPDNMAPHHSLGHADATGLSIEICQPLEDMPFLRMDIELAALVCAEWSARYNIPIKVLPFLSSDNHEAPGYVRHDRSAQGQSVGKSDPGRLFDDRAFEALVRGDDMEDSQRIERAQVLTSLLAALLSGAPVTAVSKNFGKAIIDQLPEKN